MIFNFNEYRELISHVRHILIDLPTPIYVSGIIIDRIDFGKLINEETKKEVSVFDLNTDQQVELMSFLKTFINENK